MTRCSAAAAAFAAQDNDDDDDEDDDWNLTVSTPKHRIRTSNW